MIHPDPNRQLTQAGALLLSLALLAVAAVAPAPRTHGGPGLTAPEPVGFDPNPVHVRPIARRLWSVAVSPDGKTLASVSDQPAAPGDLVLWDVARGKPRAHVRQHGARRRLQPGRANPGRRQRL